jgi:hypothetical protein
MSDQAKAGSTTAPSKLQAAYDKARAIKDRSKKPEPYVLGNIKRHKHVPIMAPKGPLRHAVDAQNFRYYEAQDRKEAINRGKALQQAVERDIGRDR